MRKTFIILLLIMTSAKDVYASTNQNIDRVEYKWYKEEIIDSLYYPKKDNLSDYLENKDNITYGNYTEWNSKYCSYSKENYLLEEKEVIRYEELLKSRYILLCSIRDIGTSRDFKVVTVFYDNKQIKYKVIERDQYDIKLDLEKEYETDKLDIYIETFDISYLIYLANDINFEKITISFSVNPKNNPKKLIWNKEWLTEKSTYEEKISEIPIQDSKSIKNITNDKICRVKEINTYRYKTKKIYYDDNYHIYIDGYIPDITTSVIYYIDESKQQKDNKKNNEINETNNEINNENKNQNQQENVIKENDSIKKSDDNKVKIKYRERVTNKIPKKIYIIIFVLLFTVICQRIKIMKKNDD